MYIVNKECTEVQEQCNENKGQPIDIIVCASQKIGE